MSKTAQRKLVARRQHAFSVARFAVRTVYGDGTGEIDLFRTSDEAQRKLEVVEAARAVEPEGIRSVEVLPVDGEASIVALKGALT